MKYHGTVKITQTLLHRLNACGIGMRQVSPFLPATISSDPEDNVDLGNLLAVCCGSEVRWLYRTVIGHSAPYVNWACYYNSKNNTVYGYMEADLDGWVIAQWLAHIADRMLTERGR